MGKQTVALGITAGIAAFKILDLVRELKKGYNVEVMMTSSSQQMVPKEEFEKVLGKKIRTEMFEKGFDYRKILEQREVEHISLSDTADIIVIAPATGNIIGKIANGIADDFLTTTIMAAQCPKVICPSMNCKMWCNPVVQENVKKLRKLGYYILGPEYGDLACGYEGQGRLIEVEKIKEIIVKLLKKRVLLKGKKVIVTAGATSEPIDAVRSITNKSSGKMGAALAEELSLRGADVFLLRAKNAAVPEVIMKEETFETSRDLLNLIRKNIGQYDYIFHAAAVSDFKVKKEDKKIKSGTEISLKLETNVKILDLLKNWNKKIKVIGFKAEYKVSDKELVKKAYDKLKESKADFIVANDVGREKVGFEHDTNEVYLVDKAGKAKKIGLKSKNKVAEEIINLVF